MTNGQHGCFDFLFVCNQFVFKIFFFFCFPVTTVGCLRPEITCEEFSHPLCLDFGYNLAGFPNALGHRTATQATTELYRYYSLVKAKCSRHVAAFLCGAHFPNCNQTEIALPCRSLCLQARTGCQPLLATFGLRRSDPLFQCDKFPETGNCFAGGKIKIFFFEFGHNLVIPNFPEWD